ncbi:hypothetical protein CPB84DRAFT_129008 [Gymnopilus junonius]|uniref:Uncharacterized protein n=1 Tax=Gymnopilus junonius TaxID=109634 RepID=A0A9P5NFM3_GYMJU|nr:hypothetical protein CPB84DRAFT_129008 [Gymnopilus junonius]
MLYVNNIYGKSLANSLAPLTRRSEDSNVTRECSDFAGYAMLNMQSTLLKVRSELLLLAFNHVPRSASLEEKTLLSDVESELGFPEGAPKPRKWIENFRTIFLGSRLTFVAMLELLLIIKGSRICLSHEKSNDDMLLYSPAQSVAEYEIRTHDSNVGGHDISPFWQLPSPELDQMWEDLYSFGISKMSKFEASML